MREILRAAFRFQPTLLTLHVVINKEQSIGKMLVTYGVRVDEDIPNAGAMWSSIGICSEIFSVEATSRADTLSTFGAVNPT